MIAGPDTCDGGPREVRPRVPIRATAAFEAAIVACYAPGVKRAHTVRSVARLLVPVAALLVALAVVACDNTPIYSLRPSGIDATPTAPADGGTPTPGSSGEPTVTPEPGSTVAPSQDGSSPAPSESATGCTGNDANLAFFKQAAAAMVWPVYCAVLPSGWFVETGTYRLANGGHLEVTYRGPSDVHLAISEGNVCEEFGDDVDACARRDAVIGPAAMGDQIGELGRLGNGLVLDVERGANPSWRIIGLGIAQEDFVAIGAAMLRVAAGG